MSPLFSPDQSEEIDDRIVEMIAAALGEAVPAVWQEMATAPVDRWVLTFCPHAQPSYWPSAPWIIARVDRGKWYDYDRAIVFPTHWMAMTAPEPSEAGVARSGGTITASDVADMASRVIRPMKRVLRP